MWQQGAAHEGEISEGVGVAKAVLAPNGIALPVIADIDPGPGDLG